MLRRSPAQPEGLRQTKKLKGAKHELTHPKCNLDRLGIAHRTKDDLFGTFLGNSFCLLAQNWVDWFLAYLAHYSRCKNLRLETNLKEQQK